METLPYISHCSWNAEIMQKKLRKWNWTYFFATLQFQLSVFMFTNMDVEENSQAHFLTLSSIAGPFGSVADLPLCLVILFCKCSHLCLLPFTDVSDCHWWANYLENYPKLIQDRIFIYSGHSARLTYAGHIQNTLAFFICTPTKSNNRQSFGRKYVT